MHHEIKLVLALALHGDQIPEMITTYAFRYEPISLFASYRTQNVTRSSYKDEKALGLY